MQTSPEFQFKVVKCHKSPLDRMLHEAIRIIDRASMNSKSETDGSKIPRIKIEPNKWQAKKESKDADERSRLEEVAIQSLREKSLKSVINLVSSSRKCKDSDMDNIDGVSPIVPKKVK